MRVGVCLCGRVREKVRVPEREREREREREKESMSVTRNPRLYICLRGSIKWREGE